MIFCATRQASNVPGTDRDFPLFFADLEIFPNWFLIENVFFFVGVEYF